MKVFLSWSGEKSRGIAEALRDWLPFINPEIQPWMSGVDIEPGARWSNAVGEQLEATGCGIVCVTRENQFSPWLNFEAGALAKKLDTGRVVPLAIDLAPLDVKQPLAQFQVKEMTKPGILSVAVLLDRLCENHVPDVAKALERNWADLEPKFEAASRPADEQPVRTERDLLEESLTIVRELQRSNQPPTWLLIPGRSQIEVLSGWISEEIPNVDEISYLGRSLYIRTGSKPSAEKMDRILRVANGFGIEDLIFGRWRVTRAGPGPDAIRGFVT